MGEQQDQMPHGGRVKDPPAEREPARWNVRSTGRYIESDAGEYAGAVSEGPDAAVPGRRGSIEGCEQERSKISSSYRKTHLGLCGGWTEVGRMEAERPERRLG